MKDQQNSEKQITVSTIETICIVWLSFSLVAYVATSIMAIVYYNNSAEARFFILIASAVVVWNAIGMVFALGITGMLSKNTSDSVDQGIPSIEHKD